jgi:hypothetical protein
VARTDDMPCGRCHGSGRTPLHHEFQQTLDFVRKRAPTTAPEIYRALCVGGSPSAANNRLEVLRSLGLVERFAKCGKAWLWRATGRRR